MGPQIVVMSSSDIYQADGKICLYASKISDDAIEKYKIVVDQVLNKSTGKAHFGGTGDLLTAMLLIQCEKCPEDFGRAIETAVNVVHGVLAFSAVNPLQGFKEINLIAARSILENPTINYHAEKI